MTLTLIIVVVLMLGVIFVNGWTDAPNAIATVVSTRVMSPGRAVRMAIVFNFLGALVMTMISSKVAATLSNMVNFEVEGFKGGGNMALIVLAAAMFSIVLWAVAAWSFGIPTSESHALIAGVSGAAIALGGYKGINLGEWGKVLIGLVISSVLGFVMGYATTKLIELLFRGTKRATANKVFTGGQAFGAAAMAFMHGAQDGQKFMGTFLLGIYFYKADLVSRGVDGNFVVPFWLIVVCSLVMGLGTSVGGYKIIKTVGMDMVKLERYQGFAADIAASLCLLFSSLTGIPVSTTHTKTTAIMGVGASKRLKAVNWGVAKEMVWAWVLTFPGCGLIAYLMSKLFMQIF
ncbi:MAG: inorganic phosphate transporter [Oscillospiraceae bacterium]|jgi:PiT family inorganic phosphate transporter|nr:inorganic phosphate transporter [Oscillospiraceae bacterium]